MSPLVAVARLADAEKPDEGAPDAYELVAADLESLVVDLAKDAVLENNGVPQIRPLAKGVLQISFSNGEAGEKALQILQGAKMSPSGKSLVLQVRNPYSRNRSNAAPKRKDFDDGTAKTDPINAEKIGKVANGTQSFREVETILGNHPEIPGLVIIGDFVSLIEENELLGRVDEAWESPVHRHQPKKRRVRHFGYKFDYGTRRCDKSDPMGAFPTWMNPIADRVAEEVRKLGPTCNSWICEQVTANEYLPGQGIPPHVDTHSAFYDGLASLSLGGSSVMRFCPDGRRDAPIDVYLPGRSLVIMSRDARYRFTHGILQRKSDPVAGLGIVPREKRVSLTFRRVKSSAECSPCPCPLMCDLTPDVVDEDSSSNICQP
eukprot:CAMPEP_0171572436 /NCGR_PEP_ID=MMETSP0961-20121227/4142_1 /TAXON_ID=87120 /ORGANISM="Aurantiochytrium limacinum, Strain ATCCMYA-1381" /LENGTH=374 /DNA_ID=CAMNT_0012127323 /DNA_START=24 /DNA_END=1148 /DNA_ORIENTATION=-